MALAFMFLLMSAGVVWLFGPFGLIGAGTVGVLAVSVIEIKGRTEDE